MKRYLLFAGTYNDHEGGWDDFMIDSSEISELQNLVTQSECGLILKINEHTIIEWAHIVDAEIGKMTSFIHYNTDNTGNKTPFWDNGNMNHKEIQKTI